LRQPRRSLAESRLRVATVLEAHSPEIAKPAERAGRAYRPRPGKLMSGKQRFPEFRPAVKRNAPFR